VKWSVEEFYRKNFKFTEALNGDIGGMLQAVSNIKKAIGVLISVLENKTLL
jgi:hypothetical protein